jgi:hypothetical protein
MDLYIDMYMSIYRIPPPTFEDGTRSKGKTIMTTSIKTNVKTITRNSVSIPTEAAATALELAGDVSDLALSTVRGAIPTTKRLGNILGMFVTGMINSDLDEHEAKELYQQTTLETVFSRIEQASLKAGQDLVSGWDESEDTKSTSEKQG